MGALEKGSIVLVTGANGFIGSHIVEQLLLCGFRVRGIVRDMSKSSWMLEYFDEKYGAGLLELRTMADMNDPGGYAKHVKGCAAFIHVATDNTFRADPSTVITATMNATTSALHAASTEPKLKHFIFTSSSTASWPLSPGRSLSGTVTSTSWNEIDVRLAYEEGPMKALHIYGASKTLAEKAVWEYVDKQKPSFVVNTVLPNFTFGPLLNAEKQGSTGSAIPMLYERGWEGLGMWNSYLSEHYIDVRDVARLHIAPLIDTTSSIRSERIFAAAGVFHFNDILEILRQLRSDHQLPEPNTNTARDTHVVVPSGRAEEILKQSFGREGFVSLRECVEGNIAHLK